MAVINIRTNNRSRVTTARRRFRQRTYPRLSSLNISHNVIFDVSSKENFAKLEALIYAWNQNDTSRKGFVKFFISGVIFATVIILIILK